MCSTWKSLPDGNSTNTPKLVSKEGIKKILQALENAAVLEKLKQNNASSTDTLSLPETSRPIDLTCVSEFIQILEQVAAPDSTQELTIDNLLKGLNGIKESLLSQVKSQ
ncbi:MAG: hypothetical protein VR72_07245 [Clostridiaceae bacterium BRH_c20a]|nr:MAG: hypothetical protein VR72_07245 [Clostridiaceae bacterium BRH_c20a]